MIFCKLFFLKKVSAFYLYFVQIFIFFPPFVFSPCSLLAGHFDLPLFFWILAPSEGNSWKKRFLHAALREIRMPEKRRIKKILFFNLMPPFPFSLLLGAAYPLVFPSLFVFLSFGSIQPLLDESFRQPSCLPSFPPPNATVQLAAVVWLTAGSSKRRGRKEHRCLLSAQIGFIYLFII